MVCVGTALGRALAHPIFWSACHPRQPARLYGGSARQSWASHLGGYTPSEREKPQCPLAFLFYPTGSPGAPRNVLVTKSTSELTLQWTEGNAGRMPTTGYVIEARPSGKGGGAPEMESCLAKAVSLRG